VNGQRILNLVAATGLVALAVAAAVLLNRRSDHVTAGATAPGAPAGPFLTASAMPAGLGGRPVPGFRLTDAHRGRFSSASLRGRPYALTFLYVHCVDVCPLIGSEIHDALAKLGPGAKRMNVVAVSVDPRGDSRRAVRGWLAQHREPANFHYLLGSSAQLEPVWRSFFVSPQKPGVRTSTHTAVIWLVNGQGRLAALISAGVPIDTTKLARDFRTLIGSRS
jgi:protein SCO1/2